MYLAKSQSVDSTRSGSWAGKVVEDQKISMALNGSNTMEPLSHEGPPLFKRPLCPKCFLSDVHANEPLARIIPLLSGPLFNWGFRREVWLYWITFYTHKKQCFLKHVPCPFTHPICICEQNNQHSCFSAVYSTQHTHQSFDFFFQGIEERLTICHWPGRLWRNQPLWKMNARVCMRSVKGHKSWAQIKECCWCLKNGESLPSPSPQWDSTSVNVKGPSTKTLELWKALSLNSGAGSE